MFDMQALIDGMNAKWQKERAETQLTLGQLIEKLESMDQNAEIKGLGELNSYRGYYCDLAFEPASESESVASLLARCKGAMGQVFQGYKGGDYMMGASTPLWVAGYGTTGDRLMGIAENGEIQTSPDES